MHSPLHDELHVRSDDLDLNVRLAALVPSTLDEATRSVDAVIATEQPVFSMNLKTREAVLEVYRMDGMEPADQLPLLDSHRRDSVHSQLGSIRNLRTENGQLVGRLFVSESEPKVWTKIREGHIKDISIGAAPLEAARIQPGQTAEINGRSYQAPKGHTLHINTRWRAREASVTPIGADPSAKIRTSFTETAAVKPKLRAFLVTMGLAAAASEQDAQAFYAQLNPADRARADAAAIDTVVTDAGTQRSEPPVVPPATPALPATNPEAIRSEAINAERERIRQLTELAGEDVPADIRTRAINEGWNVDRASREFLGAVRSARGSAAGEQQRAPAGHVRSHEADCSARALGMGLMLRSGLDPIRHQTRFVDGSYRPVRDAAQNPELLRAADAAWEYRDLSLVDICREAIRIDGGRVPHNRGEMIRAAVSGSALTNIFTTNVSAMLMQGFSEAGDSTSDWCSESDVPNFQSNERVQMGKFGALAKHSRGKTAEHLETSDSKESYKIGRYTGQFVVDEMDIIDDRLGAVDQVSPSDMGLTARQIRPNLVYAILLANAALDADSVALFHSTHANTTTGALAAATLQTAIQMMAKQRIRSRPLNLAPRFLLVPQDLFFTADILLTSAQRIVSTADGGTKNPLNELGITLRSDDRLGVAGVVDPNTGTSHAGTATNYFLTARPGEGGAKTIEVGYLRGTGRAPQLRSFMLSQGQWGVGWDVAYDIGAKALDFHGMVRSTGV